MNPLLSLTLLIDWNTLLSPFNTLMNDLFGNPLLIAAVIFLIITFFALVLLIPIEAMIVIWIPTTVLLWAYVPALRIVLGILMGFIIGLGLIQWVRR